MISKPICPCQCAFTANIDVNIKSRANKTTNSDKSHQLIIGQRPLGKGLPSHSYSWKRQQSVNHGTFLARDIDKLGPIVQVLVLGCYGVKS